MGRTISLNLIAQANPHHKTLKTLQKLNSNLWYFFKNQLKTSNPLPKIDFFLYYIQFSLLSCLYELNQTSLPAADLMWIPLLISISSSLVLTPTLLSLSLSKMNKKDASLNLDEEEATFPTWNFEDLFDKIKHVALWVHIKRRRLWKTFLVGCKID